MNEDAADLDAARKTLRTWQALYALRGYQLNRRLGGGFRVHLNAWSTDLDNFDAVHAFAIKAGVVAQHDAAA